MTTVLSLPQNRARTGLWDGPLRTATRTLRQEASPTRAPGAHLSDAREAGHNCYIQSNAGPKDPSQRKDVPGSQVCWTPDQSFLCKGVQWNHIQLCHFCSDRERWLGCRPGSPSFPRHVTLNPAPAELWNTPEPRSLSLKPVEWGQRCLSIGLSARLKQSP